MATEKKKEVKVRDLKPAKDAKGGVGRQKNTERHSQNAAAKGPSANTGRSLL